MEATLFDFPKLEITNKIRLIELFGGIGSQAMALRDIGANFEHYRLVEFDKYAVASYNAIHGTSFDTADIRNVHGADLGIVERDLHLHYDLFLPMHRFVGSRKNAGHEQSRMGTRQLHPLRLIMGSRANLKRTARR